jgi:hypothetical protein
VGLNLNTSIAWKGRRDVILDRLSHAEVSCCSCWGDTVLHALLGGRVVLSSSDQFAQKNWSRAERINPRLSWP